MQQITTFLMFVGDQTGRAEEAIELYVSLFDDSRVVHVERFGDDEEMSGVKHARFELAGREFAAMDGGDQHAFTFTPSTSLFVDFDDEQKLASTYAALVDGGQELMPLGDYGFSRRFGWVNDRFGVSWQLNLP